MVPTLRVNRTRPPLADASKISAAPLPLNAIRSVPAWPSTMSLPSPGSHWKTSSPAPRNPTSLPCWPSTKSLPSPPSSRSTPLLPKIVSLPAPPNRLVRGSAPFASLRAIVSLPRWPNTLIRLTLATVAVPPDTGTAPPLIRITPAGVRLIWMSLSRPSPKTLSTPLDAENCAVTAALADWLNPKTTPAPITPPMTSRRTKRPRRSAVFRLIVHSSGVAACCCLRGPADPRSQSFGEHVDVRVFLATGRSQDGIVTTAALRALCKAC